MPTYVYRPDHPKANEHGMIDKRLDFPNLHLESMRATIGNQPIYINYISDSMDPTRHMINGRYYESKSKFRQITKDAGCIEVGNETETMLKPKKQIISTKQERVDSIKKAIEDVKKGEGWTLDRMRNELAKENDI